MIITGSSEMLYSLGLVQPLDRPVSYNTNRIPTSLMTLSSLVHQPKLRRSLLLWMVYSAIGIFPASSLKDQFEESQDIVIPGVSAEVDVEVAAAVPS